MFTESEYFSLNVWSMKMRTLAAIPAWNQEMRVASVVLLARNYVDTVLVVNDGSADRTAVVAERAGAVVVSHVANKGYGGAIQSCFQYAKDNGFDAMVLLDSDGQHDPEDVPRVLDPIINGVADISIGSRFLDSDTKVPFYRKVGIGVITGVTKGVSNGMTLKDSQSGFRAYSRKAIELLLPRDNGMGASVELLLDANKLGLGIVEVPVSIKYDEESSTQNPVKHGLSVIGSIVRYVEFDHPLLFFWGSGFILFIIGLLTGMWSYYSYLDSHYLPLGPTVISAITGVAGILFGVTGLILHAVISAQSKMWKR